MTLEMEQALSNDGDIQKSHVDTNRRKCGPCRLACCTCCGLLLVAIAIFAVLPLNFGGMPGANFDPAAGLGRTITLVDFAEDSNFRVFEQMNDPVMGGQSWGSFVLDEARGLGILQGRVNIVPSLNGPGFLVATSRNDYPDISSCQAIAITANASNTYSG